MLSKATIGRLPNYLEYIRCLPSDVRFISATAVAKQMNLGEVLVRKDLASVCGKGKPKTGYSVSDLTSALEKALGTNENSEAVIVGAGKLGRALLEFDGFAEYGITVKCAFDKEEKSSERVFSMEQLSTYCQLRQIEIGIITVPTEAAQEVTDLLIKSGVRALWCFAVCKLIVPEYVTVRYENLALVLAHLRNQVQITQKDERK